MLPSAGSKASFLALTSLDPDLLITAGGKGQGGESTPHPCHFMKVKQWGQISPTLTLEAGSPTLIPPGPALLCAAAGEGQASPHALMTPGSNLWTAAGGEG